jgi:hypothetical protein
MSHRPIVTALFFAWLGILPAAKGDANELSAFMPRVEDYTHTWWAEGFPAHTPSAPWQRVVQTGYYAFALDTDTLRIPHFGPVPGGAGYLAAARADNRPWQELPPAELALSIAAGGKTYRATVGGKWTQFTGPRLVESGRFLQRADVTDLVFTADDGTALDVEARFETVAWPDRLALILAARPREPWREAAMEIRLTTPKGTLAARWKLSEGKTWSSPDWQEVALALDPVAFEAVEPTSSALQEPACDDNALGQLEFTLQRAKQAGAESNTLKRELQQQARCGAASSIDVAAAELPDGAPRPVDYDAARGWHRVDLDGIVPTVPPGDGRQRQNDAIERVKLRLSNPTDHEQPARLLFRKTGGGIRQRIGSPITGMSAVLRDPEGSPTGIPVQLSKNWHQRPEGGVYAGTWFHGFSQVRLPPRSDVELELTIVYGHWGGVPAASHAQLCLIGWGSNQLWDQSALGAWGESICYEPDQAQARAAILDVRPLMVRSMHADQPWHWTHNVGGGDYFRLFDPEGRRVPHARMRTAYRRHGPCLTEVTYAGRTGDGLEHSATVSLARTDDIVRGVYRLRLDVTQATEFSRFVLFQIGADTYSYTGERKMALGNETGLLREWATEWGGDTYRGEPVEWTGRVPWASLHEAVPRLKPDEHGAWANRGLVLRRWNARLGGREAAPWIAERGVRARGVDTSTLDVLPPPGLTRLEPGDFVEATFEHVVLPQFAADYYGPNEALQAALREHENTWRMVHREAVGNDRRVEVATGTLESLHPAVVIRTNDGEAELTLTGGLGFVPITFDGLTSPRGHVLYVDGEPLDQSVHGNDFWQTDYDPATQRL